jgi:phenylacetate-CoA ligase
MPGFYEPLFRRVFYPAYETVIRRRKTLAYAAEYEANAWLPAERIAELQWQKLQKLISHCWEQVPYYRERWSAAGIGNPADIGNIDDYARLPVLTKQDVRENFERLKAVSLRDRLLYKTTGGSTGEPLTIGYTRESYERRTAVMLRGYGWAGASLGRRALFLWGAGPGPQSLKDRLYHAAFNRRVMNVFTMSDDNMGRYADAVERYRPEVIVSYVASVVRLSQWLLDNRIRVHAPKAVLCAAEPLHDHQRELIERAFGCPVYNTYGCREFMLIASECEHRNGLHVNADHLRVELGEPVFADAEGENPRQILVTDLHNYGMPLMRYANGDIASQQEGDCPCGRGLPMLDKVNGRSMDALRTPQGHYIGEYLEYLIFNTPGIARFQALQERMDEIEISVVRQPHFEESSLRQIQDDMQKAFGEGVRLRFRYTDAIPLTPTGKLRVAVSTLVSTVTAAVVQCTSWWEKLCMDQVVIVAA